MSKVRLVMTWYRVLLLWCCCPALVLLLWCCCPALVLLLWCCCPAIVLLLWCCCCCPALAWWCDWRGLSWSLIRCYVVCWYTQRFLLVRGELSWGSLIITIITATLVNLHRISLGKYFSNTFLNLSHSNIANFAIHCNKYDRNILGIHSRLDIKIQNWQTSSLSLLLIPLPPPCVCIDCQINEKY